MNCDCTVTAERADASLGLARSMWLWSGAQERARAGDNNQHAAPYYVAPVECRVVSVWSVTCLCCLGCAWPARLGRSVKC